MINKILKNRFPFVSKYFEMLLDNDIDKFPQAIVFEGLDVIGQYMFSMELARILNCNKNKEEDCDCINCNWIREAKHPAVNMVTPINYKDDASKTVISINQAKKITSGLSETSDYHRFFIFADARIKQKSTMETALIKEYKDLNFNFPEEDWVPIPLSTKIFKAEASNSLLKSIEEPPKKTTFIFLSKNREDIISTIVSRSNVFKLPNLKTKISLSDIIKNLLKSYPTYNTREAMEAAGEIEGAIKNDDIDIYDFFFFFQELALSLLRNNLKDMALTKMYENHIRLIQRAKQRISVSMSSKVVLESLFLDIAVNNLAP